MPTPSDEEAVSPALVPISALDISAPMRNVFASCPPDENREEQQLAPSGEDADEEEEASREAESQESIAAAGSQQRDSEEISTASSIHAASEGKGESDGTDIYQHTSEPTTTNGTAPEQSPSPAPSIPNSEKDNDVRLAQSMATATIRSLDPAETQTPSARYLHFPELDRDRQTSYNSTTSFLRPGSKFRGTQQSDRQVYDVQVEVKDVDMAESFLCGYLRIQGLTDDHPTLTTFFEGEIIGPKYLFRTDHPSWGSSEKVDMQHWARFPAWRPLAKSALKSASTSPAYVNRFDQREHLFMRWKEYFLVPDHRVKTITGASFEGFYYICFNQCSGTVSGIYFHAKSEKFQQLELRHVEDRGCMPAVEFR